ncbi:MAG: ribose-phosphate diphosphokinase [Candidatus Obscuribacterales bacterium]|nr:ribose-phosphate diphosphokinase [Candidatus Obscuribacterales bacterium]
MIDKPLVFSTSSYEYLAKDIRGLTGFDAGLTERKTFKDGERYHRIETPVVDREVILVGGTVSDEETMELFDMSNAIVDSGALCLVVVLPYFGYSTMERAVKYGEAVKAKYRARLLSSIPRASLANRFYMLDLHSDGIPHYFELGAQTVHLYAKDMILRSIRELAELDGVEDFVIGSTDAGRSKWVESLARDLSVQPAFAFKRRVEADKTTLLGVNGPVKDAAVIIYDDMIRTGGSLINAGRAYRDAGARSLSVVVTHGVFPGDSLDVIQQSGLFNRIIATDSHPRAVELSNGFLRLKSISSIFASHLINVFLSEPQYSATHLV